MELTSSTGPLLETPTLPEPDRDRHLRGELADDVDPTAQPP
jgi:hypothetical protein